MGQKSLGYRPELDGLRAIAVGAVLLYHLGSGLAPGGFVGVDVFFVLSGFLITRLIAGELQSDSFSLLKFYERRVRRIAPALLVVCASCTLVALVILLPNELERFASSLTAAALSVSNFWFFQHSSYFEPVNEVQPLLHTWSLAVEEQFYVLFPIALAAAAKYGPRRTGMLIWCAFAVSLALSVILIDRNPKGTFYLLHTRAWELLMGSILALGLVPVATARWQREIAAIVGLAGILAAALTFNERTPFPGYTALLPCVGAALLIWSGEQNAVARVLRLKPLVFIGLISYSLYLWHWPLIVFTRLWSSGPLSPTQQVALIAASVSLSILTWYFVETPFRRRGKGAFSAKTIFVAGGTGIGTLVLCGFMVTSFRGLPGRIPYASLALAAASADSSPMRSKCHFRGSLHRTYESSCVLGAAVKPDFIVYADSHGAELSVALGKLAEQRGQSVRELTASGCAPTVGFLRGDDPKCAAYNTKMLKKLVSIPATTIVVTANAAAWSEVAAATYLPGLQTIVHGLRGAGHRVILLGSVPQHPGGVSVPAILARRSAIGEKPADYAFDPDMAHFRAIETALENVATAEHAEYVPVFPTLCDSGRCKAELGGKILYFDYGHLSMAGANLIATDLLAPLLWPTKSLVQAPGTLETQVER